MDKIYYTYVYLDPRKKGDFVYGKYHFGYEPFYIGTGKNKRMFEHLYEAKKNILKNTCKINKIKKILSGGLEPFIFEIHTELTFEESRQLEIELIKTIGRIDLGLGPLTNLTDGGEGFKNISEDKKKSAKNKIKELYRENPNKRKLEQQKRKETYITNPQIQQRASEKLKQTYKENPELKQQQVQTRKETLKNNPEIERQRIENYKNTIKNNPEIIKNQNENRLNTLKENPNLMKEASRKRLELYSKNPQIKIDYGRKASETKKNNPEIERQRILKWKETRKLKSKSELDNENLKRSITHKNKRKNETEEQKLKRQENNFKTWKLKKEIKERCEKLIFNKEVSFNLPSLHISIKKWNEVLNYLNNI